VDRIRGWLQVKLRPSLEMQVVVTNGPAALGFARTFIGLDLTEVRRGLGGFPNRFVKVAVDQWRLLNAVSAQRGPRSVLKREAQQEKSQSPHRVQ